MVSKVGEEPCSEMQGHLHQLIDNDKGSSCAELVSCQWRAIPARNLVAGTVKKDVRWRVVTLNRPWLALASIQFLEAATGARTSGSHPSRDIFSISSEC